jgi:hypothetical protein
MSKQEKLLTALGQDDVGHFIVWLLLYKAMTLQTTIEELFGDH